MTSEEESIISIFFNNPFGVNNFENQDEEIIAQDDGKIDAIEYNLQLKISSSEFSSLPLSSLREKIAECIVTSSPSINKEDIISYHFKRNALSSQLKGR